MRRSCCLAALVVIAYVGVACLAWSVRPAWSEGSAPPRRISVVSVGACPSRAAVISAVAQAMPDVAVVEPTADDPAGTEGVVVVSDAGASYRAMVGGVLRAFVDESAHCEERARKVAVVVALALEPPLIASATTPESPPAPAAEPAGAGIDLQLEVGGLVERRGAAWWANATAVHLAIARGDLGLVLGTALAGWSVVDSVELAQRIPIDLALRLRHRGRRVTAAVELGPTLAIQRTRGVGLNNRVVRVEADFQLSARIELWSRRSYGVFAALTGTYAPSEAVLFVSDPYETPAPFPPLWLGAVAGLIVRIR